MILGAGWDARAYALGAGGDMPVFELDRLETQKHKRAALDRGGVDSSGVTFVPLDFNRDDWLAELRARGFHAERPTFLLWEGVSYYLQPRAVDEMLRSVSELAAGSRIAFDYFSLDAVEGRTSRTFRYGVRALEMMGEPLLFGIPTSGSARESAADFVASHGLRLERHAPLGGPEAPFGGLAVASVVEADA